MSAAAGKSFRFVRACVRAGGRAAVTVPNRLKMSCCSCCSRFCARSCFFAFFLLFQFVCNTKFLLFLAFSCAALRKKIRECSAASSRAAPTAQATRSHKITFRIHLHAPFHALQRILTHFCITHIFHLTQRPLPREGLRGELRAFFFQLRSEKKHLPPQKPNKSLSANAAKRCHVLILSHICNNTCAQDLRPPLPPSSLLSRCAWPYGYNIGESALFVFV